LVCRTCVPPADRDAILARLVSGMTTAALARSDFSPMRMSASAHGD
jgi:hypothetical protein